MSNNPTQPTSTMSTRSTKPDWGESDIAQKAREKRLRQRLRRWEAGDSGLLDELPKPTSVDDDSPSGPSRSGLILSGGPLGDIGRGSSISSSDSSTPQFFRSSVIVPTSRSLIEEQSSRMARRREINELTMRMAIGSIGGVLEQVDTSTEVIEHNGPRSEGEVETSSTLDAANSSVVSETVSVESFSAPGVKEPPPDVSVYETSDQHIVGEQKTAPGVLAAQQTMSPTILTDDVSSATIEREAVESLAASDAVESVSTAEAVELSPAERMWDNWGRHLEVWSTVRDIADHAVGSVVSARMASGEPLGKPSLEPTVVPWDTVHQQWAARVSLADTRKSWVKYSMPSKADPDDEVDPQPLPTHDDIVEQLKNDGDLDPHEQRLLSCIVNTGKSPTFFRHARHINLLCSIDADIIFSSTSAS